MSIHGKHEKPFIMSKKYLPARHEGKNYVRLKSDINEKLKKKIESGFVLTIVKT